MGKMTGIWNTKETSYDNLLYDGYTVINRLKNFEAWALLNQRQCDGQNVLAPDGVLYCSPSCALIDNPDENWTEDDLEDISFNEMWEFYYGSGINPWCNEYCPHCGLMYRGSDLKKEKGRKKLSKRKRVQQYISQRKPFSAYVFADYSSECSNKKG